MEAHVNRLRCNLIVIVGPRIPKRRPFFLVRKTFNTLLLNPHTSLAKSLQQQWLFRVTLTTVLAVVLVGDRVNAEYSSTSHLKNNKTYIYRARLW